MTNPEFPLRRLGPLNHDITDQFAVVDGTEAYEPVRRIGDQAGLERLVVSEG